MISVHANCSLDEASLLMRARAASSNITLADVAEAVLAGTIRWDD
jgi:hypothetical protein